MRGLKPETKQALKNNKYLLKALMPNAIILDDTTTNYSFEPENIVTVESTIETKDNDKLKAS